MSVSKPQPQTMKDKGCCSLSYRTWTIVFSTVFLLFNVFAVVHATVAFYKVEGLAKLKLGENCKFD